YVTLRHACSSVFRLLYSSAHHRDLHSFPTRRSSDLRSQPQKPLLIPVKVLRGILLCGVLAVLAGVLYLSTRPQTVEGMGEVYYTDRKSTRLNSSHVSISYAVFCLKK